ncbi:MAG: RHO alpha subunit C-terminal catalytic domain-containing protein, partial [Myxococcota bacterium]
DGGFLALQFRLKDFPATYPQEMMPFVPMGDTSPPELGYFGTLFPNLHLGVVGGAIHLIVSLPDGPERTRTVRAQFFEAETARNPELLEARGFLRLGLEAAGAEDQRITEAVQTARRSPAASPGFYSPFWDLMHHAFSQQVLSALEG